MSAEACTSGADVADRALWAARLADMLTLLLGEPGEGPAGAAEQLEEIRLVLEAFDWETDDRQYALEQIDGIVNGAGQAAPDPADLLTAAKRARDEYRDNAILHIRERDDLRELVAEILGAYDAATVFDRTPEIEARLAGWRERAGRCQS